MIKKKRPETMIERVERAHHMYDNGPKPKHYGDDSIVDMEKGNSMTGLQKKTPVVVKAKEGPFESALTKVQRPKPFKNEDPSSYPMNQKKSMGQWEAVLEEAKNPKNRDERISARQTRNIIREKYKDKTQRKYLGDDELKLIGKHPSQLYTSQPIDIPSVKIKIPPVQPQEPERPINEIIRERAEVRRQRDIADIENKFGRGGLVNIAKRLI